MKKLWTVLCVLAVLALFAAPVSAAPIAPLVKQAPILMTLHNPDPELIVTVMASNGKCTTFWSRPFAIVKDVGPGPYKLYGGNSWSKDLLVLDMNKQLVASSYWPGAPYTRHQVTVQNAGEYWVFEQVVPFPNSNVQISDPGPGKMTLGIVDPSKLIVVQAGNQFITFWSRPLGVTKTVPAGPYILNGGDTAHWNLLVFDLNRTLVASSYWPGAPFTRGRATIQNSGAYYVMEQHVPSNVPNQ